MSDKYREREKGAVMLEAVIFFPTIMCMVVFLLYFGMFLLQESAMNYELQRFTIYAAKNTANPGYKSFPVSSGNDVEFNFLGDAPSDSQVNSYYQAYHGHIGDLYRGISSIFRSSDGSNYQETLRQMANNGLLFRFTINPSVEVDKNLFGTTIVAKIEYSTPAPGVMKYLGLTDEVTIRSASSCYAVNPSDFIRNTDLAVDLVEFAAEKLGFSDNLNTIISKAKEIINTIL
ncbi:MAG: hypothetical protein ACI4E0_13295 [Blautia sp.]